MGDWGVGFWGESFLLGEGREGGKGGLWFLCIYVFIDYSIGWDFSLGFFSSFSFLFFSFPFRKRRFFRTLFFFFFFSAFSIFLMKLRLPPP